MPTWARRRVPDSIWPASVGSCSMSGTPTIPRGHGHDHASACVAGPGIASRQHRDASVQVEAIDFATLTGPMPNGWKASGHGLGSSLKGKLICGEQRYFSLGMLHHPPTGHGGGSVATLKANIVQGPLTAEAMLCVFPVNP